MALRKSIEFKGIAVVDAYIKIATTSIPFGNDRLEVYVHYMASPEAPPFNTEGFQFAYDIEGENPIKQAYEQMKALEAFAGAEDC
ncbi:hypothetical protein [Pseudomonas silesiensis]